MKIYWLIATLPLTGIACAGSHAEQVRDARMERIEERADGREEKAADNGELREKLIENEYKSQQEIADADKKPGKEPTKELIALSEKRDLYTSEAHTKLEQLAVRINAAQAKIQVLGPNAPTQLQSELSAAVTEHKLLQDELNMLTDARSTSWEAQKDKLSARLDGLEDRVDQLQGHIDDAQG